MAFNKVTYSPGDVLTADQMNKIQDSVYLAEGNIEAHIENKKNPHGVTPAQIGAATPAYADNQINTHNTSGSAHSDIRTLVKTAQTSANNAQATADTAKRIAEDASVSDETKGMYGLSVDAVNDDVFRDIIERFSKVKLRPAINAELGAYDIDDANFVCDGNGENYQLYVRLMALQNSNEYDEFVSSGVDFKYKPWLMDGRYSYARESYAYWGDNSYVPVHRAYRLNHAEKRAELLCDLSSHAGSDYYGKEQGRIFAVDDKYIYFGRCDRFKPSDDEADVTLMKFDHSGNLVASKSYVYDGYWTKQQWDGNSGFAGSADGRPITNPGYTEGSGLYQTKNYIVVMLGGTSTSTGGDKHIQYRIINKNTLDITVLGDGSYASYQYGTRFAVYDKDLFYILGHHTNPGSNGAHYAKVFNLASPKTALNAGTYEDFLQCAIAGATRFAVGVEGQINNVSGYSYFLMKFCSDGLARKDISYAVVRSDAFSTTTGSFSTAYGLTTIPDFGDSYYDPAEDKFHHNGLDYEVYPTYVPPSEIVEVHKKFTAAPFFRTGGYLYFLRKADNSIYKMEDKVRYVIDHVEV